MKITVTGVILGIVCIVNECMAWNNIAEFECAATNALEHVPILVSAEFRSELTNYIATTSSLESQIAARMVLGEGLLADYNETMDSGFLSQALSVATNTCALTSTETNTWYYWHSKLLVFACHAQNDDMSLAYMVASNALVKIGSLNVTTDNPISAAILKRNRAEDLSIRQALVLSKALAAAMLKKNAEAVGLSSELPAKYQDMVIRTLQSD